MAKKAQIIRGSTQTVPIDISEIFPSPSTGRNLVGGKAYLTVKPTTSVASDDTSDTAAIIKIDLPSAGTFSVHPSTNILSFPLAPADTVNLTPGIYSWGAQTKEADGTITEIQFDPSTVELVADVSRRTN